MKRAAFVLAMLVPLAAALPSQAQQVLAGDPVDPGTGSAYVIMPGLPLILPGDDEELGGGDDVMNAAIQGDVDLVVRSGVVTAAAIPPPSLAAGGAPIVTLVAGGGSSGAGTEATFTVMLSDGALPHGSVVTNADMDLRPVTVYAFADLDDDGFLGPTDADGTADNALELQEATAYAGRQMGSFDAGRFQDSVGIQIGAPASIGGLKVALVAGAWAGSDPEELFIDGPMILTRWPFFPPLDPSRVLEGNSPPAPDPSQPNELSWDIERNYLPAPGHPQLGTPFAVSVNGSEATTDQVIVVSGAAASARVFVEAVAAGFVARSTPRLRVAPSAGGRRLVMPLERAMLDGQAAVALDVLPVDLFANVADPAAPMSVSVAVSGPVSIVSPDADGNPKTETLSLATAAGAAIWIDAAAPGIGFLTLSRAGEPVQKLPVQVVLSDFDGDGIGDDGSASSVAGDAFCDGDSALPCDDNCNSVINPSQLDSDQDGIGDCCDGTCLLDPTETACDECELAIGPGPEPGMLTSVRLAARRGDATRPDRLSVRLAFVLDASSILAPDAETVALSAVQAGGGYAAALPALFTTLPRSTPSWRYLDRTAGVDGVIKAQVKQRSDGSWRFVLKAKGANAADLAQGTAELTLALGNDIVSGDLACSGAAPRVDCTLAP